MKTEEEKLPNSNRSNLKDCLLTVSLNATTMYGDRPLDWRIYLAPTIKLPGYCYQALVQPVVHSCEVWGDAEEMAS